jgi:N-acetylmuramoyl-L-alanine amidase
MLAGLAGVVLAASAPLAGTTIVIDPGHQLGNMRNAAEAKVMTSRQGRHRYASGLVTGIRRFLR